MISLLVPCHNEVSNLDTLYVRICRVMGGLSESWELIFVNDGSTDDTLDRLISLQKSDVRVIVLDLSRNFGKEAALTAGLDFAVGDAVVPLDADLQDPPELIPRLVEKWREGYEVVNAVRSERSGDSLLKRTTAYGFYKAINGLSRVNIQADAGDFRLLSRPVIDALKKLPERRRFMKGLFAWVGFRTTTIYYKREQRFSGTTTWNYWRLWNFALEGITSFSQIPLQLASYFGVMVSAISLLYGIYMLIDTFAFGNPVRGYPSIMVAILILGGVQLMAIGIIGEYIGRVYEESKLRPVYIVRQVWGKPPNLAWREHSTSRPNATEAAEQQPVIATQGVSALTQKGASGPMLTAGDENGL